MRRARRARSRRRKSASEKLVVERLRAERVEQASGVVGAEHRARLVTAIQPDTPELARVAHAQLFAVVEPEAHVDVLVVRHVGVDHVELAGHLDLYRQHGVVADGIGALTPGERHDQPLGAPVDGQHQTPAYLLDELIGRGVFDLARPVKPGGGDCSADDERAKLARDRLDLG